jgi:HSP20 family protein
VECELIRTSCSQKSITLLQTGEDLPRPEVVASNSTDMNLISFFPTTRKPAPAADAFENLFSNFFNADFPVSFRNGSGCTHPAVNVAETADNYRIEVAAPGFSKEHFEVQVDKDLLTISAKKESTQTEGETYTRREFNFVEFKRNFHLPKTVDVNGISAHYDNGILKVTLAKKSEAKATPARMVEIS